MDLKLLKDNIEDLDKSYQIQIAKLLHDNNIILNENKNGIFVNLSEINEFSIGRLMTMSIMETVATCLYFDVNPFDQPAVEQGKKLTKKYLSQL